MKSKIKRQKAEGRKQKAESGKRKTAADKDSESFVKVVKRYPAAFCFLPFAFCSLLSAFCLLPFFLSACSPPRNPEAEARKALTAMRAKLQACLPDAQPSAVRLAVVSVSREKEEAVVRLVAYNPADKAKANPAANPAASDAGAVDFDAPNYVMSRGRWLINESGRAYLLDERCREYKLKDRKLTLRQAVAKNGRIRLQPGEASEVLLSFARLPDDAQDVALVYGTQVLRLCF